MEYCTFYVSYYEAIKKLPKESQLELYESIFDYCFLGKEPQLEGVSEIVWTLIQPQIEANIRNYTNGKKGGEKSSRKGIKNKKSKGGYFEKVRGVKKKSNQEEEEEEEEKENKEEDKDKEKNNKKRNFSFFWESYPIKKSKKKVQQIFESLKPEVQQIAIEAVQAQKLERERLIKAGEFVPEWKHPTTWLNHGCWEDVPITSEKIYEFRWNEKIYRGSKETLLASPELQSTIAQQALLDFLEKQ